MNKSIETKILIQATPTQIWKVLVDLENYPKWNPFITEMKGSLRMGEQLTLFIKAPESKGMQFKPTIMELEENRSLKWLGKLVIKGLFDGFHKFELIDNGDGSTTFIHKEHFSGLLVRFINLEGTKNGFEAMNEALKKRVEKG